MRRVTLDPDIAASAALIGDPSRAAILLMLSDGRALPAGELARLARISPQTASAHDVRFLTSGITGHAPKRRYTARTRYGTARQNVSAMCQIAISLDGASAGVKMLSAG